MKRRDFFIFFIVTLGILLLILCNRDILHYEFSFLGNREFVPEIDKKNNYILSDVFTLKPGRYDLSFFGSVQKRGSSVILVQGERDIFTAFDLIEGEQIQSLSFTVTGSSGNFRLGVSYDPSSSTVEVNKISVTSDSVLYKDSLFRHFFVSQLIIICIVLLLIRIIHPETIFRLIPFLSRKQNEIIFLLLFFLSLVVSFPFLLPDSYEHAEDLFFHLSRIEGITEGIQAGYFPVRNQLFWLKNYGYGAGYFYPDLFLYFPVALRLLGFSLLTSYKVFIVLSTFLSLCSFYLAAKIIGKSHWAGLAAAMIFGFSAYRCFAVFYRAAVGEIQAFIFFPLITLGIYYLFNGKPEKWWIFTIGFWGVLSSHIISLVLAGGLTGVYFLIRIRTIFQNKKILSGILKAFLLTVLLGAGFLFPMIEQMNGNNLNMNILVSGLSGDLTRKNISPVKNLLIFFHNWKYDSNYSRSVYPGWVLLLVPLFRLLFVRKSGKNKASDVMLASGILLLICSTDLFPWKYFVWFLNRIQFTWRLLAPASVLLSVSGAIYFSDILVKQSKTGKFIYLGLFTIINVICAFPIFKDTIDNRTYPEDRFIMQDNRVAGREYLPVGLDIEFIDKNRDTVASVPQNIKILSHKRRGLSFSFSYSAQEEESSLTFVVPLIRYHGYRAFLITENGEMEPLEVGRSDNGLVQIQVSNEPVGSVRVEYAKTRFEIAGEIITILTIIAILIYTVHLDKDRFCKKQKGRTLSSGTSFP